MGAAGAQNRPTAQGAPRAPGLPAFRARLRRASGGRAGPARAPPGLMSASALRLCRLRAASWVLQAAGYSHANVECDRVARVGSCTIPDRSTESATSPLFGPLFGDSAPSPPEQRLKPAASRPSGQTHTLCHGSGVFGTQTRFAVWFLVCRTVRLA